MTARLKFHRRLAGLAVLAMLPASCVRRVFRRDDSRLGRGDAPAGARQAGDARTGLAAPAAERRRSHRGTRNRSGSDRPGGGASGRVSANSPGGRATPQVPGLVIVYLHPLGLPADAKQWRNIIVHQTEGPAGSAKSMALAQSKNPTKRGVTVWVETDGTVYWSTPETVIPTHGDGANRNDNKYIDNAKTYHAVVKTNSIGVEFVGNYPDVAKPATREQARAWLTAGAVLAGALRHPGREHLRPQLDRLQGSALLRRLRSGRTRAQARAMSRASGRMAKSEKASSG